MTKLDEYMTVSQAAGHLGISADTLRRWDRAGKLEAMRHPVNHYRLYRESDLDRILKSIRPVQKRRSA